MTNFKSGSGNLDFGGSDKEDVDTGTAGTTQDEQEGSETTGTEQQTSASTDKSRLETEHSPEQAADQRANNREAESDISAEKYPYFIRRNNVGDERDTRLEIHVRDKIADQEAAFRSELAGQLGTNEVSKTDAREFALLAAFHHPERVAELMQEEGFGALD